MEPLAQAPGPGRLRWIIEVEFSVFGSKFEEVLRQNFNGYADLEDQARGEGAESKPFMARFVAERLEVNHRDAGWHKLRDLAHRIRAKLPGGRAAPDAARPPAQGGVGQG